MTTQAFEKLFESETWVDIDLPIALRSKHKNDFNVSFHFDNYQNGNHLNFYLNREEAYIYTGSDKGEITVSLVDPSKNKSDRLKNVETLKMIDAIKLNEILQKYLS
ncbi:MAG: hypothetical protein LBN93_10650 [Candidatus Symbiothrix sp.]|jgi:hypothetical protein|nr:hypothetical protein [Candidatus Symbiothrix sp.]